ncbi:hypothetical protein GCM10027259_43340 [Micromonospora palomenae]
MLPRHRGALLGQVGLGGVQRLRFRRLVGLPLVEQRLALLDRVGLRRHVERSIGHADAPLPRRSLAGPAS